MCTRFLFTPKSDPNEMLAFRRVEGLFHALCRIWRRLVTGGWYKSPLPRNFFKWPTLYSYSSLCVTNMIVQGQIFEIWHKIKETAHRPIHTSTKLLCRVRSVTVCKNLTCMHACSLSNYTQLYFTTKWQQKQNRNSNVSLYIPSIIYAFVE